MTLQTFFSNPNNWCQHSLHNGRGQRCLMGAMIHLFGDHTDTMLAVKAKLLRLIEHWSIEAYNDRDGRTVTDIQELVKEAGV